MANRETKRERKALAKQRRLEEMRRAARRRRLQKVYSLITTLAIVALIAGLVWLGGRAERQRVAQLNALAPAAGCSPVEKPANRGAEHITYPQKGTSYSSVPPTSGDHYNAAPQGQNPGGPAVTQVYETPLPNETQVHNLEHGHMGIQYDKAKIPADVKKALEDFANKESNQQWVFMAPHDALQTTLAFTVWDHLIKCDSPTDPAAVVALADKMRDLYTNEQLAPENAPGRRETTPVPTGSPAPTASPSPTATGSPASTTTGSPSPTAS